MDGCPEWIEQALRLAIFWFLAAVITWVYLRLQGVKRPCRDDRGTFVVGTILGGGLVLAFFFLILRRFLPFADWLLRGL